MFHISSFDPTLFFRYVFPFLYIILTRQLHCGWVRTNKLICSAGIFVAVAGTVCVMFLDGIDSGGNTPLADLFLVLNTSGAAVLCVAQVGYIIHLH